MTDILEEAKHDLEQEKLHILIKKHYKAVIFLIAIILISTITYVYFKESHIKKQEELAEEYYNLFIDKRPETIKDIDFGKLPIFEKNIYARFSELQYVNLLIQKKEYERAVSLLFVVIGQSKKYPAISNLAKVKLTEIVMKKYMKAHQEKTISILEKSVKKPNVPYYHILKLFLGQLLIETEKQKEGLEILNDLSKEANIPVNIKFFSDVILGNYLQ